MRAPSGKLNLIGITGTKGKTTTSYMIKGIYDSCDVKTGLVGTICNMIGERKLETDRTTPEANVLQPLLAEMVKENVKVCVMEASSQGLNLDRVGGCEFNLGLFTNLSPDHIGDTEHKDMDDYALAKSKLFKMCKKRSYKYRQSVCRRDDRKTPNAKFLRMALTKIVTSER